MQVTDYCLELVERGQQYLPLYGKKLSNHLPMGLLALDSLGAKRDQLDKLYQTQTKSLVKMVQEKADRNPDITITRIDEYLGQTERYPEYVDYFTTRLADEPADQVLRDALSVLVAGMSASSLHGVIRLAYAIESGLHSEIACALAYWASEYTTFTTPISVVDSTLGECFTQTIESMGELPKVTADLITDRIKQVDQHPHILYCPRSLSLALLADFILQQYQQKPNFTLLHGITSTHAMRVISPYLTDLQQAYQYFYQALVYADLSSESTEKRPDTATCADDSWDSIISKAIASGYVHTIKFVHSCQQESRAYGDNEQYRRMANYVVVHGVE